MFPNAAFLLVTGGLAVIIASALPFSSWRRLLRNILIGLVVTYVAIGGAIVMGMVFHVAIFGEPVMID